MSDITMPSGAQLYVQSINPNQITVNEGWEDRLRIVLTDDQWEAQSEKVARAMHPWKWRERHLGGQQFGESPEDAKKRHRESSLTDAETAMSALGFRRAEEAGEG